MKHTFTSDGFRKHVEIFFFFFFNRLINSINVWR
jgi:hypothetical protein